MLVFLVVLIQMLLALRFRGCLPLFHILSCVPVADGLCAYLLIVVDIVVGLCLAALLLSYKLLASFIA